MSGLQNFVILVGRVCLSLIFVIAGLHKIIEFQATANMMATSGIPQSELILIVAIIFELGGGLLVFLGWFTRFGALLLLIFVVPVTYVFHSFWAVAPEQLANQTYHFLKNLSIFGGLLYVLAFGGGAISFDYFRGKHKSKRSES